MPTNFRLSSLPALLFAVAIASPAQAQGLCKAEETISRCWERLKKEALTKSAPESVARVQSEKKAQQDAGRKTETSLTEVLGLSSSVKDFLPLLQVSGVLGAVHTDEKSGVISVALNTPFVGSKSADDETEKQLQLKATIESKPRLYDALERLLPAPDRAAAAAKLVAAKKNAQNFALHGSYNFASKSLGRSFVRHADTLNALFGQMQRTAAPVSNVSTLILDLTGRFSGNVNISTTEWKAISADDRRLVEELLPRLVAADIDTEARFADRVTANGLDVYGQLVLNQPQLQLSGSRTVRDDLFGPNVTMGRINFEMGLGNTLNDALGEFRKTCARDAASCLDRYKAFTAQPGTRAAIKAGTRVAAFVEVAWNEDYRFTAAAPPLDLAIKAGMGWVLGVDAGRLFGVDEEGNAGGRVDASLKWEAPAEKSLKRIVASLTVTRKVGEVSIPFSIVYANKEKFLTGVDYGLSANVGLKFSMFSATK